jgi:5'-3' exonuclease
LTFALLDGDICSYRAAASCEPTKIKPGLEQLEVAILRVDELVTRILYETSAEQYTLYIGGDNNFRYNVDPNYKANRRDKPKPTYLQDVRAYLVSNWSAKLVNDIEADDALGLDQTSMEDTVICSIDKDLLMIPGKHYNFVNLEWNETTPLDGLKRFYQQLIQGDQSDNIMGFDGKARPKLPQFLEPVVRELWDCETEDEMYELVQGMYMDDERLYRNGQLLWIQQTGRVKWEPPK